MADQPSWEAHGNRMKFTARTVQTLSLPGGKDEIFHWESPGFGLRLRKNCRPVYVARYRTAGGKQGHRTIGAIDKLEVADARKIARQIFAAVAQGIDPAVEKAKARAAATAAKLTLGAVSAAYVDSKADQLRPRTLDAIRRHFAVHWRPLRDVPLDAITRAAVAAQLQVIIKERGRIAAARARASLRALLSWAMKEGLVEQNVAIATNAPDKGVAARERVLSDAEIADVWRACDDSDGGRIIRLLILLGCRRAEIGEARRSEFDSERGMLVIPGSRTKGHHTLELPLPALALDLITSVPQREGRDFIFGHGRTGFNTWSALKLRIDNEIARSTGRMLPAWTFHDLRRSFRSGLGQLGVRPEIAERCIGHGPRGIQRVYDRYSYLPEIKAALAMWVDHVAALVEKRGPKVVAMKRGA
jgi:integrase